MIAYYVTFKEYNHNPRYITIEMHHTVSVNLMNIKNRLIDYGIRGENLEFVFGWSKIES